MGWWQVPHFEIIATSRTLQLSYETGWLSCHSVLTARFSQGKCRCWQMLLLSALLEKQIQETDGVCQVQCVKHCCCFQKLGWPHTSCASQYVLLCPHND